MRSLIVAALLLVVTTSASAECAWLLWVAADDARGQRTWSLFDAYPKTLMDGVDLGWVLCAKARNETAFPVVSQFEI